MLTTKQFTFSILVPLAIIVACSSALAARYVPVAIYLNGELILEGNVSDNGSPDADVVWGNLKRANLRETEAFQEIQPDKTVKTFALGTRENPVRLSVRYGGNIETRQLTIHQQDENDDVRTWRIDSEDIDRLSQRRLVSRSDVDRIVPSQSSGNGWFSIASILCALALGVLIGRSTMRK